MAGASSIVRTRWAAVGAAVAVTLGAGGLWVADAAGDSEPSTFRSITPCRLADFRPETNVGDKASPIGPGGVHTIDATGPSGNCDLPTSATAIVANVTAVDATAPTNVQLYPAGGEPAGTSNLNPVPGQPPTPNLITVGLDASGEFSMRNAFGEVDLIIDLLGYYETADFDDRYAGREVTVAVSVGHAVSSGDPSPSLAEVCRYDASSPHVLTLPLDVPVGATITGFSARVRSVAGSTDEFLLRIIREAPTTSGSVEETVAGILGVDAISLPVTSSNTFDIPPPGEVAPVAEGESYRLAFGQNGPDHALCSFTMSYVLPEVADG